VTRVLHVITGLGYGGAERQLPLLLRHLPMQCEVATLTHAGALGAVLRREGIPVHEIGMRSNKDLAALPKLIRLIRRGRYDVVHTHLYRACVFGRIAARLAGTPRVVATEHSLGDGQIEGRRTSWGVRALYRMTERLGTATVAVSPTVASRLRRWGVPAARIAVISNGIDAAAFAFDPARRTETRRRLGIGSREWVVGAVGRLVPTKRFDLLIDAFAHLTGPRKTDPTGPRARMRLLIVGDGSARTALERQVRELGMTDRVIFTGESADVAGALAAMDVFAAPSTQESFGLGVLEALAAGLPVLYTTCPALEDQPRGHIEDARRLPADAGAWSAELRRLAGRRRARRPVPLVVGRYDICEQARRLARLYLNVPVPERADGTSLTRNFLK
jgi:glycosyltransferase involved in cell wall biosynthesis